MIEVVPDSSHESCDLTRAKRICLPVRRLAMIRGDSTHAGDAFDVWNVRIHGYAIVPGVTVPPNSTWLIPESYDHSVKQK
jgi:hypothetical protein